MPDVINIGKRAFDVRKSVTQTPYSKVVINVEKIDGSDDSIISYVAGDDSGVTLELTVPWGTQQMANDILAKVKGYQYQPYNVTKALVDPAIEMGDAVQTNGVYGGVYQQNFIFGRTLYSDFSAPQEEQLDHEYTYKSPVEKRISRQQALTKAMFQIQHDNIEARVTQKGGDIEDKSFAWRLLSDEFGLYSGTKKVFTCNKDGIIVDGEIRARSGYIGTDANGFVINDKNIHNGMTAYNDKTHDGVYLGTDGIGLGKANFMVTKDGTLTAKKGVIGSDSSAWNIGSNNIYNGTKSLTDTTQGAYLGIDGIRIYNSDTASFTFKKTGDLDIRKGMNGFSDTTNSSGLFIGNDGIALGGGKLKLAKDGTLTAKSGTIGSGDNPWNIGNDGLYREKSSYDGTDAGIYIGNSGISMGAGSQKADGSWEYTAPFKVDRNGNLYAQKGTFGGTIYASKLTFVNADGSTSSIDGGNITDGTISGSSKLSDGSVSSSKLGDSSVTGSKINNGAVSKTKTSSGVQTSLDNGDAAKASYDSLVSGSVRATRINTTNLGVSGNLYLDDNGQETCIWKNAKDTDGNTIRVLSHR